jgi:hypothetical protein
MEFATPPIDEEYSASCLEYDIAIERVEPYISIGEMPRERDVSSPVDRITKIPDNEMRLSSYLTNKYHLISDR